MSEDSPKGGGILHFATQMIIQLPLTENSSSGEASGHACRAASVQLVRMWRSVVFHRHPTCLLFEKIIRDIQVACHGVASAKADPWCLRFKRFNH